MRPKDLDLLTISAAASGSHVACEGRLEPAARPGLRVSAARRSARVEGKGTRRGRKLQSKGAPMPRVAPSRSGADEKVRLSAKISVSRIARTVAGGYELTPGAEARGRGRRCRVALLLKMGKGGVEV